MTPTRRFTEALHVIRFKPLTAALISVVWQSVLVESGDE